MVSAALLCAALLFGLAAGAMGESPNITIPEPYAGMAAEFAGLPVPELLRHIPKNAMRYLPEEPLPELTGFTEVNLEGTTLHAKTEKPVAGISVFEMTPQYDYPVFYNSSADYGNPNAGQEFTLELKAAWQNRVEVLLSENAEYQGSTQSITSSYVLRPALNELKLESVMYEAKMDGDIAPYDTPGDFSCRKNIEQNPKGKPIQIQYDFWHESGKNLHFTITCDTQKGKVEKCEASRNLPCGENYIYTSVTVQPDNRITELNLQVPGLFVLIFEEPDTAYITDTLSPQYPGEPLLSKSIGKWTVWYWEKGMPDYVTIDFVTRDCLFPADENGVLSFNAEAVDLNGKVFPWKIPETFFGTEAFSVPEFE